MRVQAAGDVSAAAATDDARALEAVEDAVARTRSQWAAEMERAVSGACAARALFF